MDKLFVFTGPEIGERFAAISRIKESLKKKYGNVDFHNLYVDVNSISQVLAILQSGNLFMSAVCVVLNNASQIKKKEDIEAITKWVSEASSFPAFLIWVADEISINKALENAASKGQKQVFWELFENKKRDWVRSFFSKEKMKITDDAIETMLELVENNTDALKTVCSHLVLFFNEGKYIDEEDIENLISHTKEESAFSIFDAITYLNLEKSLAIAQKLLQVKNTSPIQVIAGLTFCFRRLLDWHSAIKEFGAFDEFNMKKKGFTSKTAIAQYKRAQKHFSIEETRSILAEINRCDFEMRAVGSAMQGLLLDMLIYFIVSKSKTFLPEYHDFPYHSL